MSLYLPRGGKMEQSVSFDAPVEDKRLILLVEDEDLVRRVARRILRREGYSVLEARDGMEGLEMLEQHHAEVALVFTDVVMPRLSGPDMAIQIRERWPTMPIVYTSGYAGDHRMLSEIEADGPVLPKPYREDELLAVLSVVLDP